MEQVCEVGRGLVVEGFQTVAAVGLEAGEGSGGRGWCDRSRVLDVLELFNRCCWCHDVDDY